MTKDLLLEIGLEEVPARFVRGALEQLEDKIVKWLGSERIAHGAVKAYATPRRLAVHVAEVAEKQADVNEEAKGPSRKIAQDADGNWSKAALGFARSQGVETEKLYFQELAGTEYVYASKHRAGEATASLLSEGLASLIASMSFPKNMRWGSYELRFVRPIRWLVALFGTEVIDMELAGVKAGKHSRGHRFLGTEAHGYLGAEVLVEKAADYVEKLRQQHVIVDIPEREQLIKDQIAALATEKDWEIAIQADLLEEVLFLVEYPSALYGGFDPSFLHIPQQVLITSMREHQRYFPVLNKQGQLQPFFVTVRNGDTNAIEQVAKGNEKVLRARLSDAAFFYAEDHKQSIDTALAKLEQVVYHEELGTTAEKIGRIVKVTDALAQHLQLDEQAARQASRTAAICKFDLVTQMVYEFPELQGIMGEDYARKFGEDEAVAKAINEHYQPRYSGDAAPASLIGAIVSLADKMDSLAGCFSIGIIPTGSQDPYALRRQAAGIVQIILAHDLALKLDELIAIAVRVHKQRNSELNEADLQAAILEFFAQRVRNVLADQGVRYDIIDAVMSAGYTNISFAVKRAAALQAAIAADSAGFKHIVDAFNRVANLAVKAADAGATVVSPELFVQEEEKSLHTAWSKQHATLDIALSTGDAVASLAAVSELGETIHAYFDHVMVMAEDDKVRLNRLASLAAIAADIAGIADFGKLVWQ